MAKRVKKAEVDSYTELGAEAQAEASTGCSACENTGLDRKTGLSEAQVCPVCNGSPFGA